MTHPRSCEASTAAPEVLQISTGSSLLSAVVQTLVWTAPQTRSEAGVADLTVMNVERKHSVTLGSLIKVMLQHQSEDMILLRVPAMILSVFFLPSEIEAVNIDSSSVL